jgi:hypothetical protein
MYRIIYRFLQFYVFFYFLQSKIILNPSNINVLFKNWKIIYKNHLFVLITFKIQVYQDQFNLFPFKRCETKLSAIILEKQTAKIQQKIIRSLFAFVYEVN